MKKIIVLTLAALMAASSFSAYAHGGRTDKNGCHMDRKTGIRHCH